MPIDYRKEQKEHTNPKPVIQHPIRVSKDE